VEDASAGGCRGDDAGVCELDFVVGWSPKDPWAEIEVDVECTDPDLRETPELGGAEHLLCDRAVGLAVSERLRNKISWWIEHTAADGTCLDRSPSPGNRDGGITTIWKKSLGAVLKAGTSPLRCVVNYAEPVTTGGLVLTDTPGYGPVSVTGMAAGGADILACATGHGSVFGSRPVPRVKISRATALFERVNGDIDFDAGPAKTRDTELEFGVQLFEHIVNVASGGLSKSDLLGFGAEEIAPWHTGVTL
jgi:altronate hydrolase